MRICFVPKNIDGGGWYRCLFPAHYLTERGHFAAPPPMSFHRPDGTAVQTFPDGQLPEGWVTCSFGEWPDADIYVLQMANEPQVVATSQVLIDKGSLRAELGPGLVDQLKQAGKKVVVEVDDDLLHVPAYNPFNDSPVWFHKAVSMADAVTVSTPSLKRSYEQLNRNITVLQNRLHWPMWAELAPVYERKEWRRLRVGWMGVLEYHKADLDMLKPWLREWLLMHPDVEFVSCGGADTHDYLNIPEAQRVTTDRTDFRHLELAYITSVMDVGLVPLAENRFNEGKSYLKGLEYSACGIVPIASPTQQYKELITHGDDGFLCRYSGQWITALDTLYADRDLIAAMGKSAYEKAKGWTYETHIGEWETFFEALMPKKETLWEAA